MNRVCCLYRVSTMSQVGGNNKDDIPMQRKTCHDFIKQKGWLLEKEYIELGVSGYKTLAADRDAIQDIKKDAENATFDVLLVFMFDRIGRREDETPFIIQWFVQVGVEVWSTQEGQQRFDNHYDKLINYLRFWFSSGESEKLSIRTKHGSAQTVREGHFRGGIKPYGYRLEKQGRTNKRGYEVHDLVIDEYQAAQVNYIFSCCADQAMTPNNIASHLNRMNIASPSGTWHPCTIRGILKNATYTGVLRSGAACSSVLENLRIVDDDVFLQVQNRLNPEKITYDGEISSTTHGSGPFLSGLVYCGHCGGRLTGSTSGRATHHKNGTIHHKKRESYTCYNKSRKRKLCDGPTSYTRHYIDDVVESEILEMLERLDGSPVEELENEFNNQIVRRLIKQRIDFEKLIQKSASDISKLKAEYVQAVSHGKGCKEKQHIMDMILSVEQEVEPLKDALANVTATLLEHEANTHNGLKLFAHINSWADAYMVCGARQRRAIASLLVDKVIVYANYEIEVYFNGFLNK